MKNLRLLDCTLRDGGYLNDWEFGHDMMVNVFERLVSSKVDVIEVGFLDQRRPFDMNRSIMPDTASVEKIYGGLDKGNAMIVGMIDYGTCGIENIQPCEESYLDGIRVIFKKHLMYDAIAFCKQIKDLGYQVFAQAVSITSYNDEELAELAVLVNDLHPYAMSMVDTYGLLHQDNLYHIFEVLNEKLLPDICLGYHAHNNFQMGYANCIEMIKARADRPMLVDGTLYGMGKSAGNAPLELLAMYLNENCGKDYDISQMLEAIDTSILEEQKKNPWGYNLFYYVAASNKCHPSYVSYLMNKHTLSIKAVNEILKKIDEPKLLLYDKAHIEQLYLEYQACDCDDTAALGALTAQWSGKKILVLGPGKTCVSCREIILNYIENYHPLIVAINFVPDWCKADYLFLTNSKRYLQMSTSLSKTNKELPQIIATSNVTKTNGLFPYELNYRSLIDKSAFVQDNSMIMLMRLFMKTGVNEVALAGFDGYVHDEMNYFNTNMEYSFVKEYAQVLNDYAKGFFADNADKIKVTFVTHSKYREK